MAGAQRAWWGACMAGGVHGTGRHAWQKGMHGRGACVARGTCVAGGVCGGGHAWQGACMAGGVRGRGACMVGGHAW